MTACNLQIEYPDKTCLLEQDEEWFRLVTEGGQERIRLHDYDRIFDVPGLYEEVVYNKLCCDSPRVISDLLKETMQKNGSGNDSLRVLDFGAGNGIVGECLKESMKTETIVGVDIIDEAKNAQERDRPEIYDGYYVMDLSQPENLAKQKLDGWNFNTLTTVAALGFGDIPTRAFMNAFNVVEDNSWIVFNIKERFFSDDDDTGYNEMLQKMIGNRLKVYKKRHYCHRLSLTGDPLYYYAVVGRKEDSA